LDALLGLGLSPSQGSTHTSHLHIVKDLQQNVLGFCRLTSLPLRESVFYAEPLSCQELFLNFFKKVFVACFAGMTAASEACWLLHLPTYFNRK
jgi:hypothetical protein